MNSHLVQSKTILVSKTGQLVTEMTHQTRFNNNVFTEITLQTRFNNIALEGFSLDNNLLITRRGLTRHHGATLFF